MAITTKTRKDLKSYFVKNAIPTEGNFADLIDAQLNQSDDGVFKLTGEPLSVVAASGDQKRVLRLYSNYPAANPDWLISLNPTQKSGETSYRAGFGITDAPGNTRLFIDATTGNLGVGTNNPQAKLDVNGGARVVGDLEATGAAKLGSLRVTNALTPSAGNTETTGIMFPADAFGGAGDRAWIRYHNARGGEKCTLELGTANDPDDHILLNPSGNVGIGIADPQAKLDVTGNARVTGNVEATGTVKANRVTGQNTLVLNTYQTVNPASNVFLHSPPSDRDAWIYLDSADAASNWGIYHRQIDSAVTGLPQNSIAFVGGGASKLQAYISLQDGSASFAGDVALAGKHAFRANDTWLRLNQDGAFTSGVHTPGNFSSTALNVGGVNSWGNPGTGNAWFLGTITVKGAITPSAGATETTGIMFPPDPFGGGGDRAWIRYHNARGGEKTTLEIGVANDGDDHILLNPSGNVGIGVAEPTSKLDVAGSYIAVRGAGNEHGYIGGDGGGGDVQVGSLANGIINMSVWNPTLGYMDLFARRFQPASDMRLKENITPITGGLEKLLKIRSVSFDWKDFDPSEPGRRSLGLVAQEVREVLPEVVAEGRQGTLTIDYNGVLAVAIEALKEQQSQIAELRKGLQQLQARLDQPAAKK